MAREETQDWVQKVLKKEAISSIWYDIQRIYLGQSNLMNSLESESLWKYSFILEKAGGIRNAILHRECDIQLTQSYKHTGEEKRVMGSGFSPLYIHYPQTDVLT